MNASPHNERILALDIGGTFLRTGLVNRNLEVEQFEIAQSAAILKSSDLNGSLNEHISHYLARHAAVKPLAVSIGFPATVDRDRRSVLSASNIEAMTNLCVADYLEPRLELPVLIDRDANMLLRWDITSMGLSDAGIVVGCYVGTGLGNAISIDGKILVGSHGVAGELGHGPLPDLEEWCSCGNRGCIESLASGRALAALVARRFPDTGVAEIFNKHSSDAEIREFVKTLAVPIAWESNILDPDVIVLGGGVISSSGFPRDELEKHVREMTRKPLPSATIQFRYSDSGQRNGLRGAAIYETPLINLFRRIL